MKLLTFTVSLAALTAPAAIAQDVSFDGFAGSIDRDVDGDLEMNGAGISYEGTVAGNLEMNGAGVDVTADVGGDMELNGAGVDFRGSVAGSTEINGAGADIDGEFFGPVEINAGGAELAGVYRGPVELNAGGARLNGRFDDTLTVRIEVSDGFFRRNRARVVVDGALNGPAYVCARRVEFGEGASVSAPLEIVADERPDLPGGVDAALVTFTERGDFDCVE